MPQRRPRFVLKGEMTPTKVDQLMEMVEELYSMVNLAGSHKLLSDTHSDTREDPEQPIVQRGDIITGQSTPQGVDRIKWQRLELGPEATVLRSDGDDVVWDNVQLPTDVEGILDVEHGGTGVATLTENAVLLGNGTDPIEEVSGLGTAGQVLTSQGAGLPPVWDDGAAGASGYWAPLTDGDVDETELIFADGDAIMVFVPVP